MRCTQIQGITLEAQRFLRDNCALVPAITCPHCGGVVQEKLDCHVWKDASGCGMFDDGPSLMEYKLKDGSTVREIVQETIWSSGPCIFICLEKDGKRMFEWPDEDIQHC